MSQVLFKNNRLKSKYAVKSGLMGMSPNGTISFSFSFFFFWNTCKEGNLVIFIEQHGII